MPQACVQVFDHFCPWIGNSVGKGNRHLFLAFVVFMSVATTLGYVVTFGRMSQIGLFTWGARSSGPRTQLTANVMWIILWPICSMPLLLSLLGLAGSQAAQVRLSVTYMSHSASDLRNALASVAFVVQA